MSEQPQYIEDDEITLKELILKIQEYFNEILKHWLLVMMIALPLAGYFFYNALKVPVTYKASLTFMINEDDGSGGLGGLSGLLGNFGFGGGGGSGEYNLDKILQLGKSRKIISKAVFDKINIGGKTDYIANHIIDLYGYHDKWAKGKNEKIKGFYFEKDSISGKNIAENIALKTVLGKILGDAKHKVEGLMSSGYAEETGILNMSVKSLDETLSLNLVENLYNELGRFYINKSTEKQQKTFDIIETKTDSIYQLMTSSEYALANFEDSNRGLTLKKDQLRRIRLQRDVQMYSLMYGEAIKNLETASFALKNKTPFVQTIDLPLAPLKGTKESKLIALIKGGVLGGFLAVFFIIIRYIYRQTMKDDE